MVQHWKLLEGDLLLSFSSVYTQVPPSDSSQPTVTEMMDTWTKQKGYPVVGVHVDIHGSNTATLSQQRFLAVPSEDSNAQADDG